LDEAEHSEEEVMVVPETPVATPAPSSSQSTPTKKSKNKKKKRKTLRENMTASSTPSERPSTPSPSTFDDIDRAIQEISKKYGEALSPLSPSPTTVTQSLSQKYSLLSVSTKNLDSDIELRKLFGKLVDIEARESRRQPIHGIPARVINRIKASQSQQRRTLMKPKDEWQLFSAYNKLMLSMDILEKNGGVTRFKFAHSRRYQDIQMQFFITVLGGDGNILMDLLREHPFHVDAWYTPVRRPLMIVFKLVKC
jgi:hypothetical protein